MDSSFGDNVGVETIAEVNRVDVVAVWVMGSASHITGSCGAKACRIPFKVAIHDCEEDLEEQVDGIDQHRQQVQPRLTRHLAYKATIGERPVPEKDSESVQGQA